MDVTTIGSVIMATLAVLAAFAGLVRWFHKRGGDERALSDAVGRHATATEELAAQVGGLRNTLESHDHRLTEHHYRIKALEEAK